MLWATTDGSISSSSASARTLTPRRFFRAWPAVTETRRTVMASYVEYVGMWRLTLTPPAINAARRVAFLVSGADKAGILHRVLHGPRQPVVLPAQAVRPAERPALWLIDAGAAARLRRSE